MTEPSPLAAFARCKAPSSLEEGVGGGAGSDAASLRERCIPHRHHPLTPPLKRRGDSRWRPGLGGAAVHSELFASGHEASGAGLALALALDQSCGDERPFLWVQDKAALRRSGRPYRPGLPPALRGRLIHVAADSCEDALFALEEGLRCRELAFVLGELAGNPRALGLTASRRLSLVAEKHGVPLWLVRLDAVRDLSSARMRWQVAPASSAPPRWNPAAPGVPAWRGELFRARAHPPGEWILSALRDGLSASSLDPSSGQSEVRKFTRSW